MILKALFLIVVFAPFLAHSVDPVFNDDVLGLIVFKAGLVDPESKLASWNEDAESPCSWDGVKCDPLSHRVIELALDGLSLSGHIGRGLLRVQSLQVLSLSNNRLNGTILPGLTRLGTLQVIDLSGNNLTGSIPGEMFRQCGSLRSVSFARNSLTGRIPDSLSSCQTLVAVNFSSNQLSGELPLGIWYTRGLQSIDLSDNWLEGTIPEGIQNLYDARTVNLRGNRFTGWIPKDVGGCYVLKSLDLSGNFLSGTLPESMRRLVSCTSIRLGRNLLTGEVPTWIGGLTSLESLDLSGNTFFGRIPESVGNLQQLKELNLSMNHFTGILPGSIANCIDISVLDVSQNMLTGDFPIRVFRPDSAVAADSYGNLEVLDVSSNAFSGEFPASIGTLSNLRLLNVSANSIFGSIPTSIRALNRTRFLDLSKNKLNGTIPHEIGGAVSLEELRLEKNFLSGKIPTEIEKCSSLTSLILSDNNLTGPVPLALSKLSNLEYVDLSSNHLSGSLPKELTNLSHLLYFNISHNNLEGELPVGGFFNTIPHSSVSGNPALCGSVVNDSCPSVHPKPIVLNPNSSSDSGGGSSSSPNRHHKGIILSISALIAIGAAASIAIGVVAVTVLNIHVRSSMSRAAPPLTFSGGGGEEFSCSPSAGGPNYGKLVMFSGDANFVAGAHALLNKDSEIGRGGFGVVYRTVLRDGRSVAIKKLTCSGLIKSQEDFEREVKTLGKIRHRNVVSLEGYYYDPSLQLLIYEYVPSGSLHRLIHDASTDNCLTWRQRFNIILGMAKGLAYLHQMNVVHYNLKSTNILLDGSGEPRLGDFGLARLLPALDRCVLSSKIQSALGYMAPEFACRTVKITEKCDVYGFGILVLEVVTGRRPVEYMEDDVAVLCDVVRSALDEGRIEECVDERLRNSFPAEEVIPVVKLGLICASQVPSNRPDMSEVVNILELIQCPSEGQEDIE
ncbi:leucine-rich repeat receptor-like protein kinase PXC2 [Punica granatum]|uniref:Leucine-rich repeat receptor-like protein kinase PXC2 n=3 Tax=Punica granatum TaxID=22663 RepID=A0A218XAU8_PUNGR|nr:leucine-rich repeat receptor-like protein kinase PXC2 [Punica granatum]OWM81621.1 hypothetical protein CDL15_Pgr007659 [Punica granatum]